MSAEATAGAATRTQRYSVCNPPHPRVGGMHLHHLDPLTKTSRGGSSPTSPPAWKHCPRVCHDPQHSGACRTYFPQPRTRRIDPGSILAEQCTMPDEATKVGMRNTDAHICAPSPFSSQCVYIYLTSTGNFPSLEIN